MSYQKEIRRFYDAEVENIPYSEYYSELKINYYDDSGLKIVVSLEAEEEQGTDFRRIFQFLAENEGIERAEITYNDTFVTVMFAVK